MSSETIVHRFRSRIDAWLLLSFIVAIGVCGYYLIYRNLPLSLDVILAGTALISLWVLFGTVYSITDTHLRIVCGPFRWRIPLAEVATIRSPDRPSSQQGLSMDRIEVVQKSGKTVSISPTRRREFLHFMKKAGAEVQSELES